MGDLLAKLKEASCDAVHIRLLPCRGGLLLKLEKLLSLRIRHFALRLNRLHKFFPCKIVFLDLHKNCRDKE